MSESEEFIKSFEELQKLRDVFLVKTPKPKCELTEKCTKLMEEQMSCFGNIQAFLSKFLEMKEYLMTLEGVELPTSETVEKMMKITENALKIQKELVSNNENDTVPDRGSFNQQKYSLDNFFLEDLNNTEFNEHFQMVLENCEEDEDTEIQETVPVSASSPI